MKNYIFGTGYFANKVADILGKQNIKVEALLKLKDFYMPIYIEPNPSIPTLELDDNSQIDNETSNIFITQKAIIMGDTIAYLRKKGFKYVYVVNEELLTLGENATFDDFNRLCSKVDLSVPFLNYLEVNIVDHCNLNCKGCAHFSNICDKKFINPQEFEKDLQLISKNFNLYYFRLLGGEPLLHPELDSLIKLARTYLPTTNIVLVTNGLLINHLSDNLLNTLKENDITVCISVYKPTKKIIDNIISKLNDFGIKYIFNDNYVPDLSPIEYFQTRLTSERSEEGRKASTMCVGRFCRFLRDGKIAKCYYPLLSYVLNEKCNLDFNVSNEDYVNLLDVTDGWQAIEKLNEYIPFCDYCSEEEMNFTWEGYHKNDYDSLQYARKRVKNL